MNFWHTVAEDAKVEGVHLDPKASFFSKLRTVKKLMRRRPGFACVFYLRVNQYLVHKKWRGSFRMRVWRHYKFANDISEYAQIGGGFSLPHPIDVTIGSAAILGKGVTIYNGVTIGSKYHGGAAEMPRIGDNVVVYTGAKVFGRITIGENSEIGAIALCTKDVPPHSVMYGIPPNTTIKPKSPRS